MGKKGKHGKSRLDKFYHLAKEQGFRSRAAFKLIQLNKKFNFLSKARCTIDLCAAPGGWLQVAAKEMPVSSLIVGVDLDSIKPIKNVITLQEDITSQKCRTELRKILKTFKADVVLNDGAPNVGGTWSKDAFSQSELCLWACKLATEFLRKGGTFVTKVFRSQDYNSLIWAFHQLFEKVEATKPTASRSESAEIFVVCQGYLAPKKIDARLLDSRYVFQQPDMQPKPDILKQKKEGRQRQGYEEGVTLLYREASVSMFMNAEDPVRVLSDHNCLKFSTPDCQKYKNHPLTKKDILECCEDIRVLGKRELRDLLRWRIKVQDSIKKQEEEEIKKTQQVVEDDDNNNNIAKGEDDDDDDEDDVDAELTELQREALRKIKRKKKKMAEAKRKLRQRIELKMVHPDDVLDTDDAQGNLFGLKDIHGDKALHDMTEMDVADMDELDFEDEQVARLRPKSRKTYNDEENFDEDGNYDENREKMQYLQELEDNLDHYYQDYVQRRGMVVSRLTKGKKQKKNTGFEEDIAPTSGDLPDYDAPDMTADIMDASLPKNAKKKRKSGESDESDYDEDEDEDDDIDMDEDNIQYHGKNKLMVNLAADAEASARKHAINRWFDNEDFEMLEADSDDETTERRIAPPKPKVAVPDRKKADVAVVTAKKFVKEASSSSDDDGDGDDDDSDSESSISSYDDENENDTAEIAAMARDLLTKKRRLDDYIDESYNRFAFNDTGMAPDWFQQDENKSNKRQRPVTKEAVLEMKDKLKNIDARPIQKVAQAKARKKMKALKSMEKLKKKATTIAETEDMKAKAKMRALDRLYSRANKSVKRQGHVYVVSKKQHKGKVVSSSKGGTRTKLVDRRMKKELNATKRREKKRKGGGGGSKSKRTKR